MNWELGYRNLSFAASTTTIVGGATSKNKFGVHKMIPIKTSGGPGGGGSDNKNSWGVTNFGQILLQICEIITTQPKKVFFFIQLIHLRIYCFSKLHGRGGGVLLRKILWYSIVYKPPESRANNHEPHMKNISLESWSRQTDRKTERQRDRGTERQRDRERQRCMR